jgi:hypothetical protein
VALASTPLCFFPPDQAAIPSQDPEPPDRSARFLGKPTVGKLATLVSQICNGHDVASSGEYGDRSASRAAGNFGSRQQKNKKRLPSETQWPHKDLFPFNLTQLIERPSQTDKEIGSFAAASQNGPSRALKRAVPKGSEKTVSNKRNGPDKAGR